MKKITVTVLSCITIHLLMMCSQPKNEKSTLFELLPASVTSIEFNNVITESDSINVLKFEYVYNGAGVGVGDFNNDGLSDIFFAGNMVTSRLYLNEDHFKFKDITAAAGVQTQSWCTGVAVVDINQDGWLDIYISTAHYNIDQSSPNLLFINQGNLSDHIPRFKEVAQLAGLNDDSYSTQAAFLDYDRDGDLDMYLVTNALENYNRSIVVGQYRGSKKSVDKLFRNEGLQTNGIPMFTNVSTEAGILEEGWGLGIAVADLNRDRYPDIYVANDFQSNDLLYINNKNGTFTNRIDSYLRHQSQNSMGMDIADFNNDGQEDIAVVDMMPDDNLRQKTMFPRVEYDRFQSALNKNYQPQYVRNVLQLNNGNQTFSDIGYLAGIYATDWSWSALFADFDNDGHRDLLISNGYKKDVTNLDFISYRKESTMFGLQNNKDSIILNSLKSLSGVNKPKFIFKNNGDLTFTDRAHDWGLAQPSYSNGVAYADFDRDGDLDLVMNNINSSASVYENKLIKTDSSGSTTATNHFLRFQLIGEKGNSHGLGARTTIYFNNQLQFDEHRIQRGYKTSVESMIHFGLGAATLVDSVRIDWPSGKKQVIKKVKADQVLIMREDEAGMINNTKVKPAPAIFKNAQAYLSGYQIQHEQDFVDFKTQRLLTQKYSQSGPALAVGDITNDGRDDLVTGGIASSAIQIYYQQPSGVLLLQDSIEKPEEDAGMLLFDADLDNDLDLYCVSGSTEFEGNPKMYSDRLYKNNGKGKLILDTHALPATAECGSAVKAADFDKDGDLDLFVARRVKPGQYPASPRHYLMINNGKGVFEDAIETIAPGLTLAGMISDALWSDFDNNGWIDLIIVGEFMPITFFKNENGERLTKVKAELVQSPVGWWNSITAGDFDTDGDIDYVAGNVGRNSFFKASERQPVTLYAKDYDQNGSIDPVLTHYNYSKKFVVHYRETLTDQLPMFKKKLNRYDTYGKLTFDQLFDASLLKNALVLEANSFSSTYIENAGDGKFYFRPLPVEAQLAPVFGMVVTDFNEDGLLDVLTIGNSYAAETLTGWYDAGIGNALAGDGDGQFKNMNPTVSGFFVNRDAKALVELARTGQSPLFIASQNQDSIRVMQYTTTRQSKSIPVLNDDTHAMIALPDGTRKQEFYYGSSYYSQSSRRLDIPATAKSVYIFNTKGEKRSVDLNK